AEVGASREGRESSVGSAGELMARVAGPQKRVDGPRPFTSSELARIRHLTSQPMPGEHPVFRGVDGLSAAEIRRELEALHRAAGRRRGFIVWELGNRDGRHDAEAAFLEEVADRR